MSEQPYCPGAGKPQPPPAGEAGPFVSTAAVSWGLFAPAALAGVVAVHFSRTVFIDRVLELEEAYRRLILKLPGTTMLGIKFCLYVPAGVGLGLTALLAKEFALGNRFITAMINLGGVLFFAAVVGFLWLGIHDAEAVLARAR